MGASFGSGTPATRAKQLLAQLEPDLPGISPLWKGRATVDFWPDYPWTRGSYSCWRVGQYTAFAGIEGRPEGNTHFTGEHTSIDFQGYLSGAVETAEGPRARFGPAFSEGVYGSAVTWAKHPALSLDVLDPVVALPVRVSCSSGQDHGPCGRRAAVVVVDVVHQVVTPIRAGAGTGRVVVNA